MTGIGARVVLDSVSPAGARWTTMEWTYPRFIHAEVMTYRMLSRNTASSRAIPLRRTLARVLREPAAPVEWGRNRPGMQAREELTGWRRSLARLAWSWARFPALGVVWVMDRVGVHKQVANRLLEPWLWHTAVVSGSPVAFEAVWRQRCHPDAQPEFRALAEAARAAYGASVPAVAVTHAPFIDAEDVAEILNDVGLITTPLRDIIMRVSTARCARVSYLTHDGRRDFHEDLALYGRLHLDGDGEVPHTSPAEHPAEVADDPGRRSGNAVGWVQWRERVDPYFVAYPPADRATR